MVTFFVVGYLARHDRNPLGMWRVPVHGRADASQRVARPLCPLRRRPSAREVKHSKWNRKRSKTPHGGVPRQIRPRCAVAVFWGIRERPRASPIGSESSRGFGRGGEGGEARRRSPKAKPEGEAAKPEGEAPPKSRPILLTPLKRATPTNTENSAQRTPSGSGTARKPQTNAEKARPIARRARAAAAAEAKARRGNRTPRRHQPRAHSQTGRRYLEDKQRRRAPEKQKVLFRVPIKPRAPARKDDPSSVVGRKLVFLKMM